jgi:hypothetical protein
MQMHRRNRAGSEPKSIVKPIQESIMNVKQLFVLGVMASATAAAFAQQSDAPLTRAEVAQSVRDARANGTLTPAGEGFAPGYRGAGPSNTTRAAVRAETRQARAAGDLVPAGSAAPSDKIYARAASAPSSVTRAEMKEQVLEARADGMLIPAGEGAFNGQAPATRVAHLGNPFKAVLARSGK